MIFKVPPNQPYSMILSVIYFLKFIENKKLHSFLSDTRSDLLNWSEVKKVYNGLSTFNTDDLSIVLVS